MIKKKKIHSDGQLINIVIFLLATHISASNFCFKTNRACKYDKLSLHLLKEIYSWSICFPSKTYHKTSICLNCHTHHLCTHTLIHIHTCSNSTLTHWWLNHFRYVGGEQEERGWGGFFDCLFVCFTISMHNIYRTGHFALYFALAWGGKS